MKKRFYNSCLVFVFLLFTSPLFSQSADLLDHLLQQDKADIGTTMALLLSAKGFMEEDNADRSAALKMATEKKWLKSGFDPETSITLGIYSYALLKALDIPGGVLYRIFPGSRYAAREVVYRGWIRGSRDKNRILSGTQIIYILRNALEWKEAHS
jgi:hypothetical protein